MILAMLLLGAAYGVMQLGATPVASERPRIRMQDLASDALTVLSGLRLGNGSALDHHLAEAYHCAYHPTPSPGDCDGARSANLSLKLDHYLPQGAGYAYALGNGVETRVLYSSYLPEGETVTATRSIVPEWNATFVVPDLSCFEPTMAANVTMLPLRRGAIASPTQLNLTAGPATYAANATASGAWNLTLDAATRPASSVVRVEAPGSEDTLDGVARLDTCDLGSRGDEIVAALRNATLLPAVPTVPVGSDAPFVYAFPHLAAVPDVAIVSANLTLYAPLPARSDPDTYVPVHIAELGAALAGTTTWSVPADSLYGVHPAILAVGLDVDGADVTAHVLTWVTVALPTGEVPIDPPYRVILQAWFPDWK